MAGFQLLFILHVFSMVWCQETILHYDVTEEQASLSFSADVGTDSGVISRVDPQALSNLNFKIAHQNVTLNIFVVDTSTGVLTTNGQLDRDNICPGLPQCTVALDISALSPPDFFQIIKVEITIDDINDNSPQFNDEASSISIPENTPVGSTFPIPRATDRDSPLYGIKGYQLIDQPSELSLDFTIDDRQNIHPSIKLEQTLDRETQHHFELEIEAFDSTLAESANIAHLSLTIDVLDANDNAPYFTQEVYTRTLAEDYDVSEIVIQVEAIDRDHGDNALLYYHFDSLTQERYADLFEIDQLTGEIRLKQSLNYEAERAIELTVTATEKNPNNLPATATVLLTITDINDNVPSMSVSTISETVGYIEIQENIPPGAFLAYIRVTDEDSGPSGEVQCELHDSANTFLLEKVSEKNYKLTTNANLDRELRDRYEIEVSCTDKGSPALSATYSATVMVLDENDHTPVLQQYEFTVVLEENNEIGVELVHLNATDPDSGRNSEVVYQILTGPRNYLDVDPYTGNITARMSFDYEQVQSLTYHVIAFDQGEISKTATATIHIDIRDQNDEAPRFGLPQYVMSVPENRELGEEVGQVSATDNDSPKYNQFIFEFLPGSDNASLFAVEPYTGRIFTTTTLNREEKNRYVLQVKAFDQIDPSLFNVVNLTINVADENDNAPVIKFPNPENNTLEIDPDAQKHSVTAVLASDKDIGQNAILTYYVTSGDDGGAFLLDQRSGILYIRDLEKVSAKKEYKLHILVKDHGITSLSDEAELNIKIVSGKSILRMNSLILVIVGVISGVIISCLLIAIILLKRRDCKSRKHHKGKGEVVRPNHHYTLQPNPINTSQESMSELSGYGDKLDSSRDVSGDTGSHDLSDMQIRYHAHSLSGQPCQLTVCTEDERDSVYSASDSGMGSHDDHVTHPQNHSNSIAGSKPYQSTTGNDKQGERKLVMPPDILQSSHDSLDSYSRPHGVRMDSFRATPSPSHIRTAKIAPRVRSPQTSDLDMDAKDVRNITDQSNSMNDMYPSSHVTDDVMQGNGKRKPVFPRVTFDLSNAHKNTPSSAKEPRGNEYYKGKSNGYGDFPKEDQKTNDSLQNHKMVTFQPYVQFEASKNSLV